MSGGDSGGMAATIPLLLNSRSFLLSAACSLTTSLGWPIIPRTVYVSLLAPFTFLLFMIVELPVLVAGMVLGCETEGRTSVCEWDFSTRACPASNASLKTPASRSPCTITWKRRNPFLNCHHLSLKPSSHEAKSSKPGVIANNLGRSCSIKLVRKPYNEVRAKNQRHLYLWSIDSCQETISHQLQVQLLVCPHNMLLVPVNFRCMQIMSLWFSCDKVRKQMRGKKHEMWQIWCTAEVEGKVDYQRFISSCEAVEAIMKACNTTIAMESENYYPDPLA